MGSPIIGPKSVEQSTQPLPSVSIESPIAGMRAQEMEKPIKVKTSVKEEPKVASFTGDSRTYAILKQLGNREDIKDFLSNRGSDGTYILAVGTKTYAFYKKGNLVREELCDANANPGTLHASFNRDATKFQGRIAPRTINPKTQERIQEAVKKAGEDVATVSNLKSALEEEIKKVKKGETQPGKHLSAVITKVQTAEKELRKQIKKSGEAEVKLDGITFRVVKAPKKGLFGKSTLYILLGEHGGKLGEGGIKSVELGVKVQDLGRGFEAVAVAQANPKALSSKVEKELKREYETGKKLKKLCGSAVFVSNQIVNLKNGSKGYIAPLYIADYLVEAKPAQGTKIGRCIDLLSTEEKFKNSEKLINSLTKMHKNSIIHRDLKTDNIVIRSDRSVAISDFGEAVLSFKEFQKGRSKLPALREEYDELEKEEMDLFDQVTNYEKKVIAGSDQIKKQIEGNREYAMVEFVKELKDKDPIYAQLLEKYQATRTKRENQEAKIQRLQGGKNRENNDTAAFAYQKRQDMQTLLSNIITAFTYEELNNKENFERFNNMVEHLKKDYIFDLKFRAESGKETKTQADWNLVRK